VHNIIKAVGGGSANPSRRFSGRARPHDRRRRRVVPSRPPPRRRR